MTPFRPLTVPVLVAFALVLASCGGGSQDDATGAGADGPERLRVEVVAQLPWDAQVFTQGLEYDGADRLLVSSGLYGRSNLRAIDPATGSTEQVAALDPSWFAEGLTLARTSSGTSLILLTWREGTAAWFDPVTLTEQRRASYDTEGWGICQLDDGRIVTSDGSDRLTFRGADTLAATGSVPVTRSGSPVEELNELACDGGTVWANVWQTDEIVGIDAATGRVTAVVDASGLLARALASGTPTSGYAARPDVLNGIAVVPGTDEYLLTGKQWPAAFRVRFVPA